MNTNTTRRSFIKAAPAAAVALAIPVTAQTPAAADRRAWSAALTAYERAKAAEEAYTPEYFRIHDAWKAGRPSDASIHWREFPYEGRSHVARLIDLEERWQQFLQGEGKAWFSPNPEATKQRYRAALDSVRDFREAEKRNDRDSGMDAAEKRSDELSDAHIAADRELMNTPAPDLAALRYKLDRLLADDGTESVAAWSLDYVAQTVADIARLLPAEA